MKPAHGIPPTSDRSLPAQSVHNIRRHHQGRHRIDSSRSLFHPNDPCSPPHHYFHFFPRSPHRGPARRPRAPKPPFPPCRIHTFDQIILVGVRACVPACLGGTSEGSGVVCTEYGGRVWLARRWIWAAWARGMSEMGGDLVCCARILLLSFPVLLFSSLLFSSLLFSFLLLSSSLFPQRDSFASIHFASNLSYPAFPSTSLRACEGGREEGREERR